MGGSEISVKLWNFTNTVLQNFIEESNRLVNI